MGWDKTQRGSNRLHSDTSNGYFVDSKKRGELYVAGLQRESNPSVDWKWFADICFYARGSYINFGCTRSAVHTNWSWGLPSPGYNPLKLWKDESDLHSNGLTAEAVINVIVECRMELMLVQAPGDEGIKNIQWQKILVKQGAPLYGWQEQFIKHFSNLISRVDRIRNFTMQAELCKF